MSGEPAQGLREEAKQRDQVQEVKGLDEDDSGDATGGSQIPLDQVGHLYFDLMHQVRVCWRVCVRDVLVGLSVLALPKMNVCGRAFFLDFCRLATGFPRVVRTARRYL